VFSESSVLFCKYYLENVKLARVFHAIETKIVVYAFLMRSSRKYEYNFFFFFSNFIK
jgi:hypothetical protein